MSQQIGKVVQITTNDRDVLYALTDTGEIFYLYDATDKEEKWTRIKPLNSNNIEDE